MRNDITKLARQMIGSVCIGDELCCCCGLKRAQNLTSKVIKPTFTQIDLLLLSPSQYICDSCKSIYDNSDMRFKAIFSDAPLAYKVIEREKVLEIIQNPPNEFVLSVPYSFKKHHWLYAGLSCKEKAYIGTDDRTVEIDYSKYDIPAAIDMVQRLINVGVPRAEIISGNYSVFSMSKFGKLLVDTENMLSPLRQSGFVELVVKYTPARKEKLIYEREGENPMLSESEFNAVNFLGSIANNSSYRKENGIQFWQGYFKRRINRFKKLDAHTFASKLAEACGSPQGAFVGLIVDLTEDQLESMMNDIRTKTDLLVAIVYSDRLNK